MADPEAENGWTTNSTGVYGPSLDKVDASKPDSFEGWTWKQIESAIVGGAALTDAADLSLVAGTSDPQTLVQAGQKLYAAQVTMQRVAESIGQQAEALAGKNGPWKGAGAEAFLAKMKYLAGQINARAEEISGGSGGNGNVPLQLINRGADLNWAISAIKSIDVYYANWVRKVDGTTGLAHISSHPEAMNQMTQQMKQVATTLSSRYAVTSEGFHAVSEDDYIKSPAGPPDADKKKLEDAKKKLEDDKKKLHDSPPPPPPPPSAPPPPTSAPPPPVTATPPPPTGTTAPPPSTQTGGPPGTDSDAPPGADTDLPPGADTVDLAAAATPDPLDLGGSGASALDASPDRADPDVVNALATPDSFDPGSPTALEADGSPDAFDVDEPGGLAVDPLPTPGLERIPASSSVAPLPTNTPIARGSAARANTVPSRLNVDSPTGGRVSADGGVPSLAGVSALDDLSSSPIDATPASLPQASLSSVPSPLATGSSNNASAGGGMPPPVGGAGGPSSPATERSDASGLLDGDVKPWAGAEAPSALAADGARAAGAASWAPEQPTVALDRTAVTAPGPVALAAAPATSPMSSPGQAAGGMPPPMGGAGGPSSPGTERSDASGLLDGDVKPWKGADVAPAVNTEGALASGSASWAPEPRSIAPDATPVSAPGPADAAHQDVVPVAAAGEPASGAGGMPPPMGGAGGPSSPGTERSDASGLLDGDVHPWLSPVVASTTGPPGAVAAGAASWAPTAPAVSSSDPTASASPGRANNLITSAVLPVAGAMVAPSSSTGAMPPPPGNAGGPSTHGTQRSDAAGRLVGDQEPWSGAEVPTPPPTVGVWAEGPVFPAPGSMDDAVRPGDDTTDVPGDPSKKDSGDAAEDVDDFSGWDVGRADFMSVFAAAAPREPTAQTSMSSAVDDLHIITPAAVGMIGLPAVTGAVNDDERKMYRRIEVENSQDSSAEDWPLGCADGPSELPAEEPVDDPDLSTDDEEKPFSVSAYLSGDESIWGGNGR